MLLMKKWQRDCNGHITTMHVTLPPHVNKSDHLSYLLVQQDSVKHWQIKKMPIYTMETKQIVKHTKMSRWVEHILY